MQSDDVCIRIMAFHVFGVLLMTITSKSIIFSNMATKMMINLNIPHASKFKRLKYCVKNKIIIKKYNLM